ncbi:hypothetical protein LXL04_006290 [Taraxacum kok-saghyz]
MNTNPDTTVKLQVYTEPNPVSETRKFKRIYVCLGALKTGYMAGRREMLGVYGCFLKGPFPGQILIAVGLDSNNGIYPVAYAVVEAENTSSWTWFLECLGEDLNLDASCNYTFISDRQKGAIPAIAKVFPQAEHRWCLRHIHENMKLQWRGDECRDHLCNCADATTNIHFVSGKARSLQCIGLDHIFSGRAHSECLLNNLCEVFNSKLEEGRDKPIITCLEPKKKRRRAADEPKNQTRKLSRKFLTVTCGKCHNKGHNSRTCKGQGGPRQRTVGGSSQVSVGTSSQGVGGSSQQGVAAARARQKIPFQRPRARG